MRRSQPAGSTGVKASNTMPVVVRFITHLVRV